jgi:hypothetical protein
MRYTYGKSKSKKALTLKLEFLNNPKSGILKLKPFLIRKKDSDIFLQVNIGMVQTRTLQDHWILILKKGMGRETL